MTTNQTKTLLYNSYNINAESAFPIQDKGEAVDAIIHKDLIAEYFPVSNSSPADMNPSSRKQQPVTRIKSQPRITALAPPVRSPEPEKVQPPSWKLSSKLYKKLLASAICVEESWDRRGE